MTRPRPWRKRAGEQARRVPAGTGEANGDGKGGDFLGVSLQQMTGKDLTVVAPVHEAWRGQALHERGSTGEAFLVIEPVPKASAGDRRRATVAWRKSPRAGSAPRG